jgi:solute carrier family 6 (neurotransmitter transporter, serotonin) member 4
MSFDEMLGVEYSYPEWTITAGWLATCSSVMFIPIYIVYKFFFKSRGSCKRVSPKGVSPKKLHYSDQFPFQRLRKSFKPEKMITSVIPGSGTAV